MKLCINCKYVVGKHHLFPVCSHQNHTKVSKPDLVQGEQYATYDFCEVARSSVFPIDVLTFSCGKKGRYYEEN